MTGSAARSRFTHDVATIGAAVVDEQVMSDQVSLQHIAHATARLHACVPLGAKLTLSSLTLQPGGGAINAACSFARLGLSTAVVARVGKDVFGDLILDTLRQAHIDIRLIQRDPAQQTGKSLIFMAPTGERTILTYRGASGSVDALQAIKRKPTPRWFYVTSLNGHVGLLPTILDYAERIGARVAWNPGVQELSKGLKRLFPIIRRTDLFLLNREEASILAETAPRHTTRILQTLGTIPKQAFVMSDGKQGAYLYHGESAWQCPALPGKRVDTTGAGDAFGSGFVAGFMHTCDLVSALRIGTLNARGAVMHHGATTGGLTAWPSHAALNRVRIKSHVL
ncbi:MAG: hypothetical protein RL141_1141 [Candidatus Parcubacteria bacterium]|jgi:ribokinase